MGCAFDGMIPISPIVDCVTGPSATCPDGKRPLPPRSLSSLQMRTDVTRCPCALEARLQARSYVSSSSYPEQTAITRLGQRQGKLSVADLYNCPGEFS